MKLIYAVRDTLANTVAGTLMVFPHDAPAIRAFSDLCRDPQTLLARHPQDFELVACGTLSEDGIIDTEGGTRTVITGAAVAATLTEENQQ